MNDDGGGCGGEGDDDDAVAYVGDSDDVGDGDFDPDK